MAIQFFATLVSTYFHKKELFNVKSKLTRENSLETATRPHFEKKESIETLPLEPSRFSLKITLIPIASYLTTKNLNKTLYTQREVYLKKFSVNFKELYCRLRKENK